MDTTYLLVSEERQAETHTCGEPQAEHAPWKPPNASSTPPNGAHPRRPGAPKSRWKTPRNGPGMDPKSRRSTPPKDRTRKPQRRKKQSRRRRSSSSTSKKCSMSLQHKTSRGLFRHGSVCGNKVARDCGWQRGRLSHSPPLKTRCTYSRFLNQNGGIAATFSSILLCLQVTPLLQGLGLSLPKPGPQPSLETVASCVSRSCLVVLYNERRHLSV